MDGKGREMIKIIMTSVFVDDQEKALRFYTDVLGFEKQQDFPVGAFRWLTVASPGGSCDVELVLEPNDNPAARTFQEALYEQGIQVTNLGADDVRAEYERMKTLGVVFTMEPTEMGSMITAVFDDTCGNLIGLTEVVS